MPAINTDPVLGKYVVVGVGGTMTELANRSTTRRLPLRAGDARLLLRRAGVVDHGPASEALVRLCAAFESGALAGFETVEINPLIVAPAECWAADAVITRTAGATELTTSNH